VLWDELEIHLDGDSERISAAPPLPAPDRPPQPGPDDRGDREQRPRFSVLTPVHDPPIEVLEQTIGSVLSQSFEDWELCLVDDGSTDPRVWEVLGRSADADPRIRVLHRDLAGGISTATNAALEMASGEYVALLDHDDLLMRDALAQVDAALRERPDTDMVYSDEVLFEEGAPTHAFTKPHWSPDLLRSQMYTCHLGVYRRSLAEEVGGFRSEFDGSQDFDFALRVTERTDSILHIPRVLYRWRAHAGSAAGNAQAKPHAYPAARRAIAEHLKRTGVDADVHFGPWEGIYRVVHRLPAETEVAVGVVADDPGESLEALVAAVEGEAAGGGYRARVEVRPSAEEAGAACADADVIVLCEGNFEPLTRFWLARLAAFALQPGVAAVGAKTLAPDGRVEHGGIAIEAGLPAPIMFASAAGDHGPLGIGLLPGNVAAVDGVVAFGGEAFRRLGGLDAEAGGLAAADYCLRGLSSGLRVVSAADVLLRRTAPPSYVNDLAAMERFRERWATRFAQDPYFDLNAGWPGVASLATDIG
jgi:hypothetical protein